MKIDRLNVHLNQTKKQKVGTLAIKNKKIYFEYDKDFLKTNIEISPYKLPLKSGLFECKDNTFEGIWGVFADSLPDGWGRLLIDRYLINKNINPNSLSPLDRLAYIGKHGMGALSYEPTNDSIKYKLEKIDLDEISTASKKVLENNNIKDLDNFLELCGSSAGAKPKILVQISDDKKYIIPS